MDCSLPVSSVCGILQAKIQEWVAVPFSRGSSHLRDQTLVSHIAGRFFTIWIIRKAPRTLRWVAISFSRRSCQSKDPNLVPCIAGRFFTVWVTRDIFWLFLNQSLRLPRWLSAEESTWQCRRCEFNPVQYYESPSIALQTLCLPDLISSSH